ncbi:MAG: WecB/TagA/CpsF family glycosyltransferase, partial [Synergistaceae bacterium]|nr:WecB/TagA/CpsF family glycosyltransferase [Synergistaceae bacterium]
LWVQKIGFEWLYRMLQEPVRWRKNLSLITFVFRVLATRLGIYKKS